MNMKSAMRRIPLTVFVGFHTVQARGYLAPVKINLALVERVEVSTLDYEKVVTTKSKRPWYLGGGAIFTDELSPDGSERLFAHHMASGDVIYLDRNLLEQENNDTPTSASVDS